MTKPKTAKHEAPKPEPKAKKVEAPTVDDHGLIADVDGLLHQISALQSTLGEMTIQDQSLLDGIEQRANNLAGKLQKLCGGPVTQGGGPGEPDGP